MPSLYVLIPGFGNPQGDAKLSILKKNLETIYAYPWTTIQTVICQYDDSITIPIEWVEDYGLTIVHEKGVVGDFMKRWASPEKIQGFDYILTFLDDVEWFHPDWNKYIEYVHEFEFDLLSPCLTQNSKYQYEYMRFDEKQPMGLKVTPCCEFFAFFAMTSKFKKYWEALEEKNPWMWGLDLILRKHLNLRVALVTRSQIHHWFKNESYRPDLPNPVDGFKFMMEKYNETAEALANQCPIMYYIVDPFWKKS